MDSDVNVVEFLENLQGNKPPFECPFEDCKKICKTHKSIANHIHNQHQPPNQEIVTTPNDFSPNNIDNLPNTQDTTVKDRISSTPAHRCSAERQTSWLSSPSPLGPNRKRKSSTTSLSSSNRVFTHREQMSYADSRKFVMLEAVGRTYRHNIHTPIEIIEEETKPAEDNSNGVLSSDLDTSSNEPLVSATLPQKNGFIRKSFRGRPFSSHYRQSRFYKNKKCQSTEALLSRLPKLPPPLNIPAAQQNVEIKMPQPQYSESSDFPVLKKSITRDQSAYIHYIEKSPEELEELIEYDLDEEDLLWLERYNKERSQRRLQSIDQHTMELVIDRFEKLAYFRSSNGLLDNSDDDAVCSVCLDGTCENTNAILFCDVCNLAVHQECYGVPYIPEGQWLCRKCIHSPSEPVSCVLCPNKGGAFKKTTDDRWAHVICALWVPEVMFVNLTFLEPVEHIEKIAPARWRLQCYICKQRNAGACIQCHKTSCYTAFHVTCAQQAGLYMKIEHLGGDPPGRIRKSAFCDTHAPSGHFKNSGMYAHSPNPDGATSVEELKKKHLKNTRKILAERRNSKPNILLPVIPPDKFQKVIDSLNVSDKKNFVIRLHAFWKLKREFRRGVPLLKRLQVAGSRNVVEIASCDQETKQLREQMKFWQRLRQDLEKARLLSELIRKRERLKREIFRLYAMTTELKMQPFVCFLRRILDQLQDFDRGNVFTQPVKEKNAPGYFDIVKQPMDLSTMRRKAHNHEYTSLSVMEKDFNLMIKNCCLYNPPESSYYKLAVKFQDYAEPIFKESHQMVNKIQFDTHLGVHVSDLAHIDTDVDDKMNVVFNSVNQSSSELKIFLDDELLKELPASERCSVSPLVQFKLLRDKVARHAAQSCTTRDQREKMREWRNSLQRLRDYYHLDNDGRSMKTKSSTSSPSKVSSSEDCSQLLSQISPSVKSEGVGAGRRKASKLSSPESPKSFRSRNHSIQEDVSVSFAMQELPSKPDNELSDSTPISVNKRNIVTRRTRSSKLNKDEPEHTNNCSSDSYSKSGLCETPELRHRSTRFSSPETARCSVALTPLHLSHDTDRAIILNCSPTSSCSTNPVKCSQSPPAFNNHSGSKHIDEEEGAARISSVAPAFTNYRSCRAKDMDDDEAEDEEEEENDDKFKQPASKRKRLVSTDSKRSGGRNNQQSPGSCSSVGSPLGMGFSEFGERYPGSDPDQDEDENIQLEPLDIVWAKCRGYPWYPGLIIDPFMPREGYTHNGVPIPVPPESVLSVGRDSKEQNFLVLFFDVKRTWQWLTPEKLEPLGVDADLDRDKLLDAKRSRLNNSIRKAYSAAIEHLYKVNGTSYPHSENGNS